MNRTNQTEFPFSDHSGHRDRLRERLSRRGADGLSEREMMEFLLCYVLPRRDVSGMAAQLIDRFGSVRGALCAEADELSRLSGIGSHVAAWLACLNENLCLCEASVDADRPGCGDLPGLTRLAEDMRAIYAAPCSVQLCVDAAGGLLFRREICPSLEWGEAKTLRLALGDAIASNACAVAIVLMGKENSRALGQYDLAHAKSYGYTLRRAGVALSDVVLYCGGRIQSLRDEG